MKRADLHDRISHTYLSSAGRVADSEIGGAITPLVNLSAAAAIAAPAFAAQRMVGHPALFRFSRLRQRRTQHVRRFMQRSLHRTARRMLIRSSP